MVIAVNDSPSRLSDMAIDVRDLTKRFGGAPVVDHISLRVARGRIYGFLGPNGSGKTTTIRMLCGLLTPDEGQGTCLGYDLRTQSADIKRHVGYMTQRFTLYDDLTIAENLDFIARLYAVADRRAAVERTLSDIGLTARRGQLAGQLSGGWKQRLALAACLLHSPHLLLLDEPTAGVDPQARREFWDKIHRLAAGGMTVLVSTHYMDEAERCHELAYIAEGRLLVQGAVADVVGHAGLVTWAVVGGNADLADALRTQPGVEMVVPFGTTLHISGTDAVRLNTVLAPYRADPSLQWTQTAPSLEDVFIHLMKRAAETRSS